MFKHLTAILFIYVVLGATTGCSSATNEKLVINFSSDSTAVVVDHIDAAGLHQLKAGKFADIEPGLLISVLDTPSDDDSLGFEKEVKGRVIMVHDHLEFRPGKPFEKGKQYQVMSYLNTSFGNLESTVRGQTSFRVKPNQKLLVR